MAEYSFSSTAYHELMEQALFQILSHHGIDTYKIPAEEIAKQLHMVTKDIGCGQQSIHIMSALDNKFLGAFRYRSEYDHATQQMLLIADDFRFEEA